MAGSNKKLLVEGDADKDFFRACCQKLKLDVEVGPPTQFGAGGKGRDNALNILPSLLENMADGTIKRLGLVIDADFHSTDKGFDEALSRVKKILNSKDYEVKTPGRNPSSGFLFKHRDGLPDFGLWIMPDNTQDGIIEDFIKRSIVSTDSSLFNRASKVVATLPEPKFKPIHISKAEVATWMAWQQMPGQKLAGTVGKEGQELIDFTNGLPKFFLEWLKLVYQ